MDKMRSYQILATPLLLAVGLALSAQPKAKSDKPSACALVEQALDDSQHVKIGTTRQELEKYFVQDGGMAFREHAIYVYPTCNYIKIDVHFKADPSEAQEFSPKDTVSTVSQPFLEYPRTD